MRYILINFSKVIKLLFVVFLFCVCAISTFSQSVWIHTSVKNLESISKIDLISPQLQSILTKKGYQLANDSLAAQKVLMIQVETYKAGEFEGVFTSKAKGVVKFMDNTGTVEFTSSVTAKGAGLNYISAGEKSISSIAKKIADYVDDNLSANNENESLSVLNSTDVNGPEIIPLYPVFQNGIKANTIYDTITFRCSLKDNSDIKTVKINDQIIKDSKGMLSIQLNLTEGDNFISIEATDEYGNTSNKTLIVSRNVLVQDRSLEEKSKYIVWNEPSQPYVKVPFSKYTIDVCIKAEQVSAIKLVVNGTVFKEMNNTEASRGECSFTIKGEVNLKEGKNTVSIVVSTPEGTEESSRTIDFQLTESVYHALVIASQTYEDDRIADLSFPIQDAQKLIDVLVEKYTFDRENVIFLQNPTKAEIIGALHSLRTKVSDVDNLLIFYAGHGLWDKEMSTGYWLPVDADKDNPVNWMPNTDLTNYLKAIKAKHILLLADACFSGGIFRTRAAFKDLKSVEKLYNMPSRKAITSGTLKEVPDQSVFIHYILNRLNENINDYLSGEQLFSSIRMAVINNSPNVPQYGTIQNTGDEGGDFIFIKRK